jgi:micrococcal nuclease
MKRFIILAITVCSFLSIALSCAIFSPSETTESETISETSIVIPLEITSVKPNKVHVDGGTPIEISGDGFTPGTTVSIRQRDQVKAADNIFVSSSTIINCRIPSFSVGFAHVTVTKEDGNLATLENALIYSKLGYDYQLVTRALVVRVIDGDTIEVDIEGRIFDVRYIGIDTPEIVHPTKGEEAYGKEASEKNRELVEGKTVILEKDVSETDQYGRLLRYVYVDDLFVNAELVRLGYAQVSTYPPDVKYQELFLQLQKEARENSRGLWGIASPNQASSGQYLGSVNSDIYHYPSCIWAQSINAQNEIWFNSIEDAKNQGYRACKVCKPP